MVAYVIATMTIHDPETYKKYTERTPAVIKKHGGRFLTRGNEVSTLEGDQFKERMVILEFPSKAHVEAMFEDPEYDEAAAFRRAAAVTRIIVQEGLENTENPNPNV